MKLHRRRPRPPDGRVDHHHRSQPEVGRRQPHDGDRPSHVVGGGVLAHRRVDADWQRDHQSDEDGQQPELDGDRQSSQHALLDAPTAQQRLAEGAAQQDAADPAPVLHGDRQIQAEPALHGCAVDLAAAHRLDTEGHDVDDVAGDEAHRQEYQHAQNEQGGNDQQQPPDDVGSHIFVKEGRREARRSRRSSLPAKRARQRSPTRPLDVLPSQRRSRLAQNPISRFRSWSIQRRARTFCA